MLTAKNRLRNSFTIILVSYLLVIVQFSANGQGATYTIPKRPTPNIRTGKPMIPFTATDLSGKTISSADLKGHIYVLNLWFVACKPCLMEIPELNKMVKKYKDQDVKFIALALDDADAVRTFLKNTAFDYMQIPDTKFLTLKDLSINIFPTHVVVDKDNKISFMTSGYSPRTVPVVDEKVGKLLKQK